MAALTEVEIPVVQHRKVYIDYEDQLYQIDYMYMQDITDTSYMCIMFVINRDEVKRGVFFLLLLMNIKTKKEIKLYTMEPIQTINLFNLNYSMKYLYGVLNYVN